MYISLYVLFYCLGARLPVICIRLQFALYLASNASPQCRLKESRLDFYLFIFGSVVTSVAPLPAPPSTQHTCRLKAWWWGEQGEQSEAGR